MTLFLATLLQLVSPASAGTGPHLLSDAKLGRQGTGEISASVDAAPYLGRYGTVRTKVSVTDRLRFDGGVTGLATDGAHGGDPLWEVPGYAGARYLIVEGEFFSVAPFAGLRWSFSPGQTTMHKGKPMVSPAAWEPYPGAGIALEGGIRRVRIDLAVAVGTDLDFNYPILVGEAGVTVNLTDADSVRVGTIDLWGPALFPLPAVSYRHDWSRVFVGAQAGFTPLPGIGVSAGMIW